MEQIHPNSNFATGQGHAKAGRRSGVWMTWLTHEAIEAILFFSSKQLIKLLAIEIVPGHQQGLQTLVMPHQLGL